MSWAPRQLFQPSSNSSFFARIPDRWLALAITVFAFGLRLYRLGQKNIWWDEGFSVFMARLPLAEMMAATAHDTHPPGYYALLHFWRLAAGDSEVAVRLLSAFAGVLLAPLAFRLLRPLAGARAALCAAGLIGLSRVLIWYSQEVRQYALAACLALASAALAVALWRKGGGWVRWAGYVAVNAAGLLTLYLFASVLAFQNLAFLIAIWRAPNRQRLALAWISAQLAIALIAAPWIVYYLPRAPHFFTPPSALGLAEVLKLYLATLFVGDPSGIDRYWASILFATIILLAGGVLAWRAWRPKPASGFAITVLLIGTAATPALVWLLNLPTGLGLSFVPNPRYFVLLAPWALCALGLAAGALVRRRIGLALVGVLAVVWLGFAVQYYGDRYLTDNFKSAAATLAAYRRPDDVVFLNNDKDWPVIAYHLGGREWTGINSGLSITSDSQADQLLETAWNTHPGLWLLLTPDALVSDPDQRVYHWLEAHALASREYRGDPAARLYFFARTPERASSADVVRAEALPPATLAVSPAPGLTLMRAEWPAPEYRQGESLRLFLYWRNEQAVGEYVYELRLTTLTGQLADTIQHSLTIDGASPPVMRQQVDIPVRPYVSPGLYRLSLFAGPVQADLGLVTVLPMQPRPIITTQPATPQVVQFEGGIRLLGYDARTQANHLTLRSYWTTTALLDTHYKLFAHAFGEAANPATGSNLWGQLDREPGLGAAAVTTWRVGETITEQFDFDLPAGVYTLAVGWYDFFSGQRLLALDDAGQAVDSQAQLGPFTVNPPP